MNNIYVETMPETLAKSTNEDDVNTTEVRMWFKTDVCIKFLAEALAEERKRVVQEVREKAFKKEIFYTGKKSEQGWKNEYWLFDFELDQIERGE